MIRRTYDAGEINELINDPSIRPTVGGEGYLDAAQIIADRRNIALVGDGGGALFVWRGPGVYEGHSFFLVRGKEAVQLARAILAKMSRRATLIWGLTPKDLKHVHLFNRLIGFECLGEMDTPEGPHILYEMRF